ncbi:sigma-54 interaction domain-containing protein [Niastella sp. OAS944]|uniref:sigma-54 interaction domain-containing protein n=1 Tax=Niastella sp. OAS944 TaxID=2664089 RepID=UPI003499508C|nr:transcriptional regulator with GAF, ATPase, and Fis domain [Chitinophagaceae bacterium OAS944]
MDKNSLTSASNSIESSDTAAQKVLEALRQKENEQATLLCLASRIAAARNRQDLENIIDEEILALFKGAFYTLCLLHDDKQTHFPFLGSNTMPGENNPVNDGIFDVALSSTIPLVFKITDLVKRNNTPSYILHWQQMGIEELMLVRIINGNEHKGVLFLYAEKPLSFLNSQFGLFAGMADLLGTGICNVLANEKIERQLEEINQYKQQLEKENFLLLEEQRSNNGFANLIGGSIEIQKVYRLISQVAASDATVLVLGETGTGKELVARALHEASPRKEKLMVKVNCAAMPANLIESELFGHEKGSFTGALERRIGKFELANNSTIFLDEIGELPLELQSKLLRAIQEKEIERIGGRATIKVNVRIIAATNRDLEKEVAANRFRNDLFYRLNVFPISLPPLRKRTEDIPALVSYFIERFARNSGKNIVNISHKALEKLMNYSWPGNIRELEHLIERTVLLTNSTTIKEVQLPEKRHSALTANSGEFHIRPLADIEREYILKAIKMSRGKISGPNGAAAKLELPSTTLISKMQKLGIKKEHFIDRNGAGE